MDLHLMSSLDSVLAANTGKTSTRTFSHEECSLVVSGASVHRLWYPVGWAARTVVRSVERVGML